MPTRANSQTAASHVVSQPKRRDLRLDFFRGLALFFIFIDHIPDNVLSWFTLHDFAFCDAAEMFIFISGYTAALAYAPVFDREGVAMGIARIYRRVWQLYVAHLFLFMIFSAEVAYTMKVRYNPLFADELAIGDYLSGQGEAFIRVLLLQFQPNLLNILPLYIILLLGLPYLLLLMRRNVLLGLVPSAVLWMLATQLNWNMPGFPDGRLWYFNPFAWQFLFAIAVALGFLRENVPWPRGLTTASLVFAAVACLISVDWALNAASQLSKLVFAAVGLVRQNLTATAADHQHIGPRRTSRAPGTARRSVVLIQGRLAGGHLRAALARGVLPDDRPRGPG